MRRAIPVMLLCSVAMLSVVQPAEATSSSRQIVLLKRANARLTAQLRSARDLAAARADAIARMKVTLAAFTAQVSTLNAQVAALSDQTAASTAQISTLTTQRDNALSGLPAAIKGVPLDQFATLVFAPAREARLGSGCGDSFYSSDGYISYDFNLGKFCN